MKKIVLSLTLFTGLSVSAQNVNIPDANFKTYLLADPAINLNSDSEIQVTEANAFAGTINCNSLNILDFTGLEAFTSLTNLVIVFNPVTSINLSQNTSLITLQLYANQLTSLDVSNNTLLVELRTERNPISTLDVSNLSNLTLLICGNNALTSLDLSNNPNLELLDISNVSVFGNVNVISSIDISNNIALNFFSTGYNPITSLDFSNNSALQTVYCPANELTSLDVSMLPNLEYLSCEQNDLTALNLASNLALTDLYFSNNPISGSYDLSNLSSLKAIGCNSTSISALSIANGNNLNFTNMQAYDTPNLTCIEVDDEAWAGANWDAWNNTDPTDSYSEDCVAGITSNETVMNNITIYPNPTSSNISIEIEEVVESVSIFNIAGKLVQQETTNSFSVETLPAGIYILNLSTDNGFQTARFVKD